MLAYPPLLPCVSRIEGHSATIFAGLVRTPMEAGNTRQRRTHRVLPHRLSLVFVMAQEVYAAWLAWVNENAFDQWILMSLPGDLAARAGTPTAPTPVRFVSDVTAELMPADRLWYWRCRVEAEWLPSAADLGPAPFGPWILADRSTQPTTWPAASRTFNLTGPALDAAITFARASAGTYVDANGLLVNAAANTPRFDQDPVTLSPIGLLLEEARTNSVPNNTLVGGVAGSPGTVPTGWAASTTASGLVRTLAYGTEDGAPYVDIRWSGTPASSLTLSCDFTASNVIAAASGQVWTGSAYVTLQAGANTNTTPQSIFLEFNAALGNIFGTAQAFTPAAGKLRAARLAQTLTLANATTAFVMFRLRWILTAGAPIDFTVRVGLPQVERGASASTAILTTNAAATRAADVASLTGANFSSWWRADEGSVQVVGRSFDATLASSHLLWGAQGATTAELLQAWRDGSTAASWFAGYVGGVNQAQLRAGPMPLKTPTRLVMAYRLNDYAAQADGGAIVKDTSALVPTVDRLYLGSQSGGAGFLNGTLAQFKFYAKRLPLEGDTGTPPDWLLAGTPSAASPDTITGGTPVTPSALA